MRIEPAPSAASAAGTSPAATAAADPPLEPPGVRSTFHGLRVTPQVIDSVNGHSPQLRHLGLADHDRSRRAQPLHHLGVGRGGRDERAGASTRDLAADVDLVLDRDRHPEQRPVVSRAHARIRLRRLQQRALLVDRGEGVQLGIEPRDPGERELDELLSRRVAAPDELGLPGHAHERDVVVEHRPILRRCPAAALADDAAPRPRLSPRRYPASVPPC